MDEPLQLTAPGAMDPRPWDARLARALVAPLKSSWVTPNHLTTLRLAVGIAAAAAFTSGRYGWSNLGALLLILSNFLDHADGELARLSGKGSRIGHIYDLASDAICTIALFFAMGIGVDAAAAALGDTAGLPARVMGLIAGVAVAIIFWLRMRIESMAGKAGTRQASVAGFETEDILYLLPAVTLCNVVDPFLKIAAVGAPLFAIWVAIDFRRVAKQHLIPVGSRHTVGTPIVGSLSIEGPRSVEEPLPIADCLARNDLETLRQAFIQQGCFVSVRDFAEGQIAARLADAAEAAKPLINRNYIPGHKQGGSVSRHSLDRCAPAVGELYRDPILIEWLGRLCGESLQPAPSSDPHAYALYYYTAAGDHIGWHYDNSYYAGRRYTLLLGVIDDSSCRLEYELHTREAGAEVKRGSMQLRPGDLVFFDGDRLRHRITPLGRNEERVSLTFEYVTDPHMHPWWRFVSNMKDAIAYFGFRQVFSRASNRTPKG
jgi:phosphatidylglycerophosphate synthase